MTLNNLLTNISHQILYSPDIQPTHKLEKKHLTKGISGLNRVTKIKYDLIFKTNENPKNKRIGSFYKIC